MGQTVKIGFVGTGGVAGNHLQALAKLADVQLVGCCDLVLDRARQAVENYGGKAFDHVQALFDTVDMDAVYLCLPPFAHGPAEKLAIQRGMPFFVEKPPHIDAGAAREIAAAVEEKRLLTCVGYMNRYRQSVNRAKDILAARPPVLMVGGWVGGVPPVDAPIHQWWVRQERSGGQFVEQVTHTVDLVRYLCGEAAEVFAHGATGFVAGIENYDIPDAMTVNVRMQCGAVCTLVSCCAASVGGGVFLDVWAPHCAIRYRGWDHTVEIERSGLETERIKGEPNIFDIQDAAFIAAVRQNDPLLVRSTYGDAVKTLELTLAANRSYQTGKPVTL